jgi:hypothetical protein
MVTLPGLTSTTFPAGQIQSVRLGNLDNPFSVPRISSSEKLVTALVIA